MCKVTCIPYNPRPLYDPEAFGFNLIYEDNLPHSITGRATRTCSGQYAFVPPEGYRVESCQFDSYKYNVYERSRVKCVAINSMPANAPPTTVTGPIEDPGLFRFYEIEENLLPYSITGYVNGACNGPNVYIPPPGYVVETCQSAPMGSHGGKKYWRMSRVTCVSADPGVVSTFEPTAKFRAIVPDKPHPVQVTFINESTGGALSYLWDFGDGNTSTEENPVHTYTSAGTPFKVKLTVSNKSGSDTATANITIKFQPCTNPTGEHLAVSCIGYKRSQCIDGTWWTLEENSELCGYSAPPTPPPPPQNCSNPYGTPGSYDCLGTTRVRCDDGRWTPIEYNSSQCGYTPPAPPPPQNCSDPYGTPGSYDCLGTTRVRCDNGTWTPIEYNSNLCGYTPPTPPPPEEPTLPGKPAPIAAFTVSEVDPKTRTYQFEDTSIQDPTAWVWDFGDGTGSTSRNPVHTYANPGTYHVTLTASNSTGKSVAKTTLEVGPQSGSTSPGLLESLESLDLSNLLESDRARTLLALAGVGVLAYVISR